MIKDNSPSQADLLLSLSFWVWYCYFWTSAGGNHRKLWKIRGKTKKETSIF